MAGMKVTLGSGGGGHEAPGGQRGDEEHAAARSANISAAVMVARGTVIWLTVLGRAARVIGCDGRRSSNASSNAVARHRTSAHRSEHEQ
jgi:hypothetical protein